MYIYRCLMWFYIWWFLENKLNKYNSTWSLITVEKKLYWVMFPFLSNVLQPITTANTRLTSVVCKFSMFGGMFYTCTIFNKHVCHRVPVLHNMPPNEFLAGKNSISPQTFDIISILSLFSFLDIFTHFRFFLFFYDN